MRPHWTQYLPEVGGPIVKRGEEIAAKATEAQRLFAEVSAIQREIADAENALHEDVKKNWTQADIGKAKMDVFRKTPA